MKIYANVFYVPTLNLILLNFVQILFISCVTQIMWFGR